MEYQDCVVILAGGQGARLKPYTTVLPKPLIPVGDVPILEVIVHQLRHFGFRRLILAVNYCDGLLRSYFGDGKTLGVDVSYSKEEQPLGTVGPLHLMADQLPDSFLVMNGDILTGLNYRECLEWHQRSGHKLTVATFNRRIDIADGVVEFDAANTMTSFREKPTLSMWVSLGVYAMNRSILDLVPTDRPFGMDELVGKMLERKVPINTYPHDGEWYDIGSPQDLERANEAFAARRETFVYPEHQLAGTA